MLTQRGGGWPLTMFLTHDDQRPFFGGTYFPKEARFGLPAFSDMLLRVAALLPRASPASCGPQSDALHAAFAELNPPPAGADSELTAAPLEACRAQLARSFDPQHGGFGGAPKFPHPQTLALAAAPLADAARQRPSPICRRCTWRRSPCAAWPRAASTISSAGASAATRWTSTG